MPIVSAYRHNTRGRHTTHLEKLTINNRLTSDLKSVELVYRYEYMYARIRSVFDGACLISCSTVYTSDRSSAPRRTRSYCGQRATLSSRFRSSISHPANMFGWARLYICTPPEQYYARSCRSYTSFQLEWSRSCRHHAGDPTLTNMSYIMQITLISPRPVWSPVAHML